MNRFDERWTREQLLALLRRAAAGKRGKRDHLMLLIGVTHGLRVSEICDLRVGDFDLEFGTIKVRRGKGSNDTRHVLGTSTEPLLDEHSRVREYLAELKTDKLGRLFDIGRGMCDVLIKQYARDCDIPKHLRHMHVLKHSCAHFMFEHTNDITAVQSHLGHVSLSSTGLYTRMGSLQASQKAAGMFK